MPTMLLPLLKSLTDKPCSIPTLNWSSFRPLKVADSAQAVIESSYHLP